jgi:hypothetical protein
MTYPIVAGGDGEKVKNEKLKVGRRSFQFSVFREEAMARIEGIVKPAGFGGVWNKQQLLLR